MKHSQLLCQDTRGRTKRRRISRLFGHNENNPFLCVLYILMKFRCENYKLNGYIQFNFLLLLLIYLFVSHGTYHVYYLMKENEGAFSFLPIWGKRDRNSFLQGLYGTEGRSQNGDSLKQRESKSKEQIVKDSFQQSCPRISPPQKTSMNKPWNYLHYILF